MGIIKRFFLLLVILLMTSCDNGVIVPDFTGMPVSSAMEWSKDNNIKVSIKSYYNDEFGVNLIYSQSIEPETVVNEIEEVVVYYSLGVDPSTNLELPNFDTYTLEEVAEWFDSKGVRNYEIIHIISDETEGSIIDVQVTQKDEEQVTVGDHFEVLVSDGYIELSDIDLFSDGKWQGVNLGGWFVLEGWMTPELFEGVSGSDETIFLQQKYNAEEVLIEHWETFITDDDFKYLNSIGVKYVRLPIPWWLYGETAYVGTENEVTYISSVDYIHQAMVWAEIYNISVLLDLHTAPGGQNGFDNGGLTGVQNWGKNEEEFGYIAKTVEVLDLITKDFSKYESLWGIEVLNEPSWSIDMTTLQDFYLESYKVIRETNKELYIGFHDGFRMYDVYSWRTFFEKDLEKVFLDTHIYSVFSESLSEFSIFEHIEYVDVNHRNMLKEYENIVPVIVGEWSYGLPNYVTSRYDGDDSVHIKKAFGYKQIEVYNEVDGWFFWNYKIDQNAYLEWDFYRLYEKDYLPD